ncbi:FAD/NAD(P)-binding domain-containing protein [Punctularia strigosozonata HHB-11173 SS5]|uniref:FAD/NAD(P)-binding domain-containing protein n=1 Tax=Punctularia strigosozonata (strain HHB-11173) TaxID=741275 RepID=UPI00044185FD|nr:FAD/NAD(P)-binding domain-containing protein [Punctularia strigosozonata HHB-11173 SS5]EIN12852.1 FAD/NAD(P)-binding domain-containing protein [Punctularia strigosozonata HHB-11173 SS5]
MTSGIEKKRVLVVGAGAAGMSCADMLSQHPDKFDVTLVEAQDYCGGQAFSIPIDEEKHGAAWLNQGVQGGSWIYHHTIRMFNRQGYDVSPVELQVSFGKGEEFWTNVFPTKLVERHAKEIKRFKWAVKVMRWFELFFAILPIKVTLKLFMFSDEFINYMILPSMALFLGTGNATPDIPTVMMERLYTSPTYGMWYPVDDKSLSSNLPPMNVFPEFTKFYDKWQASLEERGVKVRLSTEVTGVRERSKRGVKVAIRPRRPQPDRHNPNAADQDLPESVEQYDELVLCVLADAAKVLLGKTARWVDRFVLGNTKWSDDVTVTHNDVSYMEKWYTPHFDPEFAVAHLHGRDDTQRIEKAKKDFRPMYFIKEIPDDPRKLEMCFDCSAFQYQIPEDIPFENHVFQTIFLNKAHDQTWSKHEISQDKIIREDWWHQLCHAWTHYLFVVPWLWLLNGNRSTRYAAAWTLVNAHELAVISGMAAAYQLGADYPADLDQDSFARMCFRLYLLLTHGSWYKRGKRTKA